MGGIDEEVEIGEPKDDTKVVSFEEAKPKRRPFAYWKIRDRVIQLKLKASFIERVEAKYGNTNIIDLVFASDGLPALGVMLTVIQAAAMPWNHGLSYTDVQNLYDIWCEDGGNQTELFKDIVMPLMAVSGFFSPKQTEEILARLEEATDL